MPGCFDLGGFFGLHGLQARLFWGCPSHRRLVYSFAGFGLKCRSLHWRFGVNRSSVEAETAQESDIKPLSL